MATTDAKPGFRLPWSSDRSETARRPADAAAPNRAAVEPVRTPSQEIETPDMIDAAPAATDHEADRRARRPTSDGRRPPTPRRRVRAAPAVAAGRPQAEQVHGRPRPRRCRPPPRGARADTLARFDAEAKTHIEAIHATPPTEATDLRQQADDDVAGIRDWSKAEIARIREETDERIADRKTDARAARSRSTPPSIERAHRAGPGPRRRLRDRDGRLLRAPAGRGGPDPLRGHGREPARAARRSTDLRPSATSLVHRPLAEAASRAPAVTPRPSRGRRRAPTPKRPPRDVRPTAEAEVDAALEARSRTPPPSAGATGRTSPSRRAESPRPQAVAAEAAADAPADAGDLFSIGADDARRGRPAPRRAGPDPGLRRRRGRGRHLRRRRRPAPTRTSRASPTTPSPPASPASCRRGRRAARPGRHDPGRRRRPRQRRQHRRLQAPPVARRRRPVGRRLVRPRRRVRLRGRPRPRRRAPRRHPDPAGLRRPRHRREPRRDLDRGRAAIPKPEG